MIIETKTHSILTQSQYRERGSLQGHKQPHCSELRDASCRPFKVVRFSAVHFRLIEHLLLSLRGFTADGNQ